MRTCHIWPRLQFVARAIGIVRKAVPQTQRPLRFLGDSQERIREFPEEVREDIGAALMWAQCGDKHPDTKPLSGFGGASVLEVVENNEGDTYRAVYTVRYANVVYVLHCFQKKSKKGSETPKHDINLIKERLRRAEELERRK